MSEALEDLRVAPVKRAEDDVADIVIVSGASIVQIRKQVGFGPYSLLAQNGNDAYFVPDEQAWRNELTWIQKFAVFKLVERLLKVSGESVGDSLYKVEDRGCQISYSATGHKAPIELKKAYDPDGSVRKNVIDDDLEWFNEMGIHGIKYAIGGTTCIDFYTHTKGENVARFVGEMGWRPDECVYVGDALFEGGNDATVIGVVPTVAVEGPEDTLRVIKSFL